MSLLVLVLCALLVCAAGKSRKQTKIYEHRKGEFRIPKSTTQAIDDELTVTPHSQTRHHHHIINRGLQMDKLEKKEKMRSQNKNPILEMFRNNTDSLHLKTRRVKSPKKRYSRHSGVFSEKKLDRLTWPMVRGR